MAIAVHVERGGRQTGVHGPAGDGRARHEDAGAVVEVDLGTQSPHGVDVEISVTVEIAASDLGCVQRRNIASAPEAAGSVVEVDATRLAIDADEHVEVAIAVEIAQSGGGRVERLGGPGRMGDIEQRTLRGDRDRDHDGDDTGEEFHGMRAAAKCGAA